jgi:hypothetical protein
MYTMRALQEAFGGDNAKALMTMNPADYEKFATRLFQDPDTREEEMNELQERGQICRLCRITITLTIWQKLKAVLVMSRFWKSIKKQNICQILQVTKVAIACVLWQPKEPKNHWCVFPKLRH